MRLLLLLVSPRFARSLQSEIESGSMIGLCLGPDCPPVFLNDSVHGGQTYSGSFKFRVGVEALEYTNNFSAYCKLNPAPLSRTKMIAGLPGCWMLSTSITA
jgi:hypothetical protein